MIIRPNGNKGKWTPKQKDHALKLIQNKIKKVNKKQVTRNKSTYRKSL